MIHILKRKNVLVSIMKKSKSKIYKFGFFTDSHFSVIRQDFRTDSFFDSVLSKMRQSYEHFKNEKCEFVLFGGDFFDKYASNSRMMLQSVRDIIMGSGLTTYFIWGQHDLLGYEQDSSKGSNLAFLEAICDGRLVGIKDSIDIDGAKVFASHVYQKPEDVLKSIPQTISGPVVVLVHSLLAHQESPFGQIDIHNLPNTRANLVLSGDLHCGYDQIESKGTLFYNPGSLARTSRENRKPKSCVVTVSPIMNDWNVEIEDFYPECEDFPFPEIKEEIVVSKEQDSSEYIEAFEKFKFESKDIFERLDKVGKEHGIPDEILKYIASKKKY